MVIKVRKNEILGQNVEGGILQSYHVDEVVLEKEKRKIRIPEGISDICPGAFEEYNRSGTVNHIYDLLKRHEYHLVERKKRLRTKSKFEKHTFPEEIKTLHQRAEYLLKSERQERLLQLYLPVSLESVEENSFPVFLESIEVEENNKYFRSEDGTLLSRDGRTLIRYPGFREEASYEVPVGVEKIGDGAFSNAFLHRLIIPPNVKQYGQNCFRGCEIEELIFAEGVKAIDRGVFTKCDIKKIVIPSTAERIGDYAFEEISGLEAFVCGSEKITMGVGIFRKGNFKNIGWWCFDEIPKAAFLNAKISSIDIPNGVERIADYAFAGCYEAKKIRLPDSVKEIGPQSFDMGPTYNYPVKIPQTLYRYAYRFPARSRINGKPKNKIWQQRTETDFWEEKEVLLRQRVSFENLLSSTKAFQVQARQEARTQMDFISRMLES